MVGLDWNDNTDLPLRRVIGSFSLQTVRVPDVITILLVEFVVLYLAK